MKRCSWCIDRFSDYIDGELSASDCQQLQRHLSECPGCERELRAFSRAHNALLSLSEPLAPSPVLAAVRARLDAPKARRRVNRWIWLPAPALAAAVMALAVWGLPRWTGVRVAQMPSRHSAAPSVVTPGPAGGPAVAYLTPPPAPKQGVAASVPIMRKEVRKAVHKLELALAPMRRRAHSGIVVAEAAANKVLSLPSQAAPRRIVVVAYHPPTNYCASAQDPESGETIAEVSVRSTYAPDGSVAKGEAVLHFPAPDNAKKEHGNQDSRSENRSDIRPYLDLLVGRV